MQCPRCHSANPEKQKFCGECGTPFPSAAKAGPDATKIIKTPDKELATGSTFAGRYQIIEELGRGGMGRVYKVLDTKIKDKVALKLIRPDVAADPETVERFSNELKLARRIRHKNICGMFDLGEAEGAHFITMEYVHGEDLKSVIRMTSPLHVGTILSVGKQICDGLSEAHRLGIVHRDLKPQNIMIDKGGNAKIMDFGIARLGPGKGLTGAGVVMGTPEYMSPEQAEAKEVDARSDIYSLGIILYEMATGRPPFEGQTGLSVAMKQAGETPKSPAGLNAALPEDLDAVILKCLEKDKARRYPSAAALRDALDDIEKGIPTGEKISPRRRPTTSKEITVKFQVKKLILPVAAGIILVAAAVLFGPWKASLLDPNLIAVAVFENKTGDPKLDNVGSLAAERIMQGLTQVGEFSVAPIPSAEALSAVSKGKDRLRALAEMTKAGKIVCGDYFLAGDKLQFHAWVQDMDAGKNLLALEPAGGPAADPAAALEPLRLRIMGGLATIFDPLVCSFFVLMKEPPNLASYRDYVEGMRTFLRQEFDKAAVQLLRAAERDPNLVVAKMQAACAYQNIGQFDKAEEIIRNIGKTRADFSTGERGFLDWLEAGQRGDNVTKLRVVRNWSAQYKGPFFNFQNAAEASRNNLPKEAVEQLGYYDPSLAATKDWVINYWDVLTTALHMNGDHKRELKEARRARKQLPEIQYPVFLEGRALAALGRVKDLQKLIEESKKFSSESGASPGYFALEAGREMRVHGYKSESAVLLSQALRWYEGRPEKERASADNRYNRARALYLLGRWTEAKPLFEGVHQEIPDALDGLGYLGAIAARLGDRDGAMKVSKQLEDDKRPYLFGGTTYWRARIAALLGDEEEAVNLLRQAFAQGWVFSNLPSFGDFESLYDYPPYVQLMKPKG